MIETVREYGRKMGGRREREKKEEKGRMVCLPVAERNRVDGIISHSPTS